MNVTRTIISGGDLLLTVHAQTREQFDEAKTALMTDIDAAANEGWNMIRTRKANHGEGRTLQAVMTRGNADHPDWDQLGELG